MLTPEGLNALPNGIIRSRILATVGRTADSTPSGLEPLAPFITIEFLHRIKKGLALMTQEQRSGWSLAESVARLVADVTGAPRGIPDRACNAGNAEGAVNSMCLRISKEWAARKKIMQIKPGATRDARLCVAGSSNSITAHTAAVGDDAF